MKNFFLAAIVATVLSSCGSKEDLTVKTEKISGSELQSTFKVWGNCETCKETIESSLQVEGVTGANWNVESKMLTVRYDTTKISLDQVERNVASVGYDNVKYKGDDNAYEKLPNCCKYDRK